MEQAHDFLWRAHVACPPNGYIGIFNRSHDEDVLITRVHGWITGKEAQHRLRQIRGFETDAHEERYPHPQRPPARPRGRFFLHISKAEQKTRLLARPDNPDKRWKFSRQDHKERGF
jgi:polyphosphate kinase 2 (PPK2 family)